MNTIEDFENYEALRADELVRGLRRDSAIIEDHTSRVAQLQEYLDHRISLNLGLHPGPNPPSILLCALSSEDAKIYKDLLDERHLEYTLDCKYNIFQIFPKEQGCWHE